MNDSEFMVAVVMLAFAYLAGLVFLFGLYYALRYMLRLAVRWVGAVHDWILGPDKDTEAQFSPLRDRQSFIHFWHGREH